MKLIWFAWIVFFLVFYLSHRRVHAASGGRKENRVRREPASNAGLGLQIAAIAMANNWPGAERPDMIWPAVSVAVIAIWFAYSALLHLGRQWRITAVVTDDHELITSGPYRIVRHPLYLAFLLMTIATVMIRAPWGGCVASLAVFLLGTEIRVRAEEKLLAATFPVEFPKYAASVPAYIPGLR